MLYVVHLDGPLAYGDSGSVIIDGVSADFYGHIVSGCVETRTAYVSPAQGIFDDISTVISTTVDIAFTTSDRSDFGSDISEQDIDYYALESLGEKEIHPAEHGPTLPSIAHPSITMTQT